VKTVDVIVIGAGASGLMCALTASQKGRSVLVLDSSNKVGKKILMSGGGRCNFTNLSVTSSNYISSNPHFCKSALKRYTQWDFIALVERHGIAYEERKHGQLFCLDSARDILNMLLEECALAAVTIKTHVDVTDIKLTTKHQSSEEFTSRYLLSTNQGDYAAHSVVIATGALSIPTMGASGFGYDVATRFGLNVLPRRAGLVPFMFTDATKAICERLSGLALDVEISFGKQVFRENMLFTHRGVSGPVVLQISNYWQPGDEIHINLLPDMDLAKWLVEQKHLQAKSLLRTVLSQYLSKGLVQELQLLFWSAHAEKPLADFPDKLLLLIAENLQNWRLKPSGTEGYRTAEVTVGGVDTDELSSKTMECKKYPGLFFIGEVVDVTGHLGGFNFQWAWSSGYTAGLFV
jgi:predicted Rossmann fold flavoprotein